MRWAMSSRASSRLPGVCGGGPCIVRTYVPLWVLEQAWRLGHEVLTAGEAGKAPYGRLEHIKELIRFESSLPKN
jgi:uncharacterized protein (DUF433 family)